MKPKVFIDGREGTTGLQLYERLSGRQDIDLILIDEGKRKDPEERRKLINASDLVFLCLPDAAAVEAAALAEGSKARIIDASTAHRVAPGWVYGFAELGARDAIAKASRVANPGCHATGFLSAAAPLVKMGIAPAGYPFCCYSLTGYSGGGKKMIAEYTAPDRPNALDAPNLYALGLQHKHLPEMQKIAGLSSPPVFCPVVCDIYKGMATTILLDNRLLNGTPSAMELWERLASFYEGQALIKVAPFGGDSPRLAANELSGKDSLKLVVCGHETQTSITALFDNLGKGASGAAVQNMNLMLGFSETESLYL